MQIKVYYLPIIIVVSLFAFFIHNREMKEGIMEIRNFVTAREIVQEDSWLIPTMNGELRLEKPPLPTWIAAAVYTIDGNNLALQRIPAALAATLLLLFFFYFVHRFTGNGELAFTSTLVLGSSFYMIFMGRTATWDIYCHAFMMGAILFLYQAITRKGKEWIRFIVAGILMGLSYLSKGPVAFHALLLPFLLAWIFTEPTSLKGKWKQLFVMVIIMTVVGLWWTFYLYVFEADKMAFAMNKEIGSWSNRSVKPWWYYWNFFIQTGIWSIPALFGLFYPLWKHGMKQPKKYLFAVLWALFALIALSVVPKKDPRYLFPMLMPLALCIGFLIQSLVSHMASRSLQRLFLVNYILVALIALCLPIALTYGYYVELLPLSTVVISSCLFLAIFVYMIVQLRKKNAKGSLYGVVLLMMVIEGALPKAINEALVVSEKAGLATLKKTTQYYQLPFYYLPNQSLRIELVYYADKKILPLDVNNLPTPPFLVITNDPIEQIADKQLLNQFKTKEIGVYDDNMKNKNRQLFISHVTLFEE